MNIRRVLLVEGSVNAVLVAGKLAVGFAVGSMAIIGDALHSLTDLANNVLVWLAHRVSRRPPDPDHPYGHRKFEHLAVFALATLLVAVALQLAIRALTGGATAPVTSATALLVMVGVLLLNVANAAWEGYWARRLDSDLLRADVRDSAADVLTTVVVIVGWQLSARGWPWLDRVLSGAIALLILYLAWGLFQRAVPMLVDQAAEDPGEMAAAISAVPHVREVRRVRSRGSGEHATADVVVSVDPGLSTDLSHSVADAVERLLAERFHLHDVTVHVEPHERD